MPNWQKLMMRIDILKQEINIVIPVGMSPVQSYRVLDSIIHLNLGKLILATSEQTQESGIRISELFQNEIDSIEVIDFTNIKDAIDKSTKNNEWALFVGPGTREMSLELWHNITNCLNSFPRIWVDHRQFTKRLRPRNGEFVYCLNDVNTKYKIKPVQKTTACSIYGKSLEELVQDQVDWNENRSTFTRHFNLPKEINPDDQKDAINWEQNVYTQVKELRKKYGSHAIHFTRDPVPKKPRFWLNIGYRMGDNGIRGGAK